MKPGIHDGVSNDAYHADCADEPSLSSSIAKILLSKTPRHAWFAHPRLNPHFIGENAEKFDIGEAAHALMLGDPRNFSIIEADNWRTKQAQQQREEAYVAKKIPLLFKHWHRVQAMVNAGRQQLKAHHDAADAFTDGKPEQTLIWIEHDVWCRARLDWKPHDHRTKPFDDYKSTGESADPDQWQRIAFNLGFDVQAAFYRRGIRALGLNDNPRFRFVVQETEPPYCLSVIELSPGAIDLGERKVEQAIERWRWCMQHNKWPGYPSHTATIDVPDWHETRYLERETRDQEFAKRMNKAAIPELWLDWQRPT